jgi:hypothetical protein
VAFVYGEGHRPCPLLRTFGFPETGWDCSAKEDSAWLPAKPEARMS